MSIPNQRDQHAADAHANSMTHPDPVPSMGGQIASASEQTEGNKAARQAVADRATDANGAPPAQGSMPGAL